MLRPIELFNAGFELQADGWLPAVYGAQPTIDGDTAVGYGGQQSLRISSTEPTDTALSQEVALRPGHWYRFRGWVRMRDLAPQSATVSGTFQIQQSGGKGIIASGPSKRGDTDWSEVTIEFERRRPAPRGSRPSSLASAPRPEPPGSTISRSKRSIWPARLRDPLPGQISPLQYGQFIEYLCNLVPSMWAEKLYDGSFEGLTPYKVAFLKETDFREKPWYPWGQVNRADYALDTDRPISGRAAQRIGVRSDAPCTVGLAQDGIAVDRTIACDFSVYLRQSAIKGPVRVGLLRDGQELSAAKFEPSADWQKFRVTTRG